MKNEGDQSREGKVKRKVGETITAADTATAKQPNEEGKIPHKKTEKALGKSGDAPRKMQQTDLFHVCRN